MRKKNSLGKNIFFGFCFKVFSRNQEQLKFETKEDFFSFKFWSFSSFVVLNFACSETFTNDVDRFETTLDQNGVVQLAAEDDGGRQDRGQQARTVVHDVGNDVGPNVGSPVRVDRVVGLLPTRGLEFVDGVVAGDVADEEDDLEEQDPAADVLEGESDGVDVDVGGVDNQPGRVPHRCSCR